MRHSLFFIGCLLISGSGLAQFGNEWINFSQSYYKIPVAKDGIYRLTWTDLQSAGFPLTGVDPRRLQLFHRGTEQAIYVKGQEDALFNQDDHIEFYGRKNDGTLDADLYKQPSLQPNPYYGLYNDTTYYFLTYNPLPVLGKRMEIFSEVNVTNIPKETYYIDEKLIVLSDQYAPGIVVDSYLQNSVFDEGEGWTGPEIRQGEFRDYIFSDVVNGVQSAGAPQLELVMVGRGSMNHRVEISAGSTFRVLSTQEFSGFSMHTVTHALNWTDIGGDGKLTVRVRTLGTGGADRVSVSYMKLRYPQATNAGSLPEKIFQLRENGSGKSYIEISNPAAGSILYDVTDPSNVVRIGTSGTTTLNAVVPGTFVTRKFLLSNTAVTPSIREVKFRQFNPSLHDYVIISHPVLMKPAAGYSDVVKEFADYRASDKGGSYKTLVVDINQLYDQFNYGETSPRAIRQFMKFMVNTKVPKYLFLIGKSLDVGYRYFRSPSSFNSYKDLVPTAGLPGSDSHYTAGLAGSSAYEPAVPTGRLTAMSPVQVAAYLNKVKEAEALPYNDLWRKDILHLSGGGNAIDLELFRLFMEGFRFVAEDHYLGGKVRSVAKQSTDIEFINISEEINKGVNLVTFFGHSAPFSTDIEIGFVTNPALGYNNPGRYPMFLVNGCNAGTFFANFTVFGEDWMHAANKGAVGLIAHSSYGLANTLKRYSDIFYEVAYGDSIFIEKGIGDIQKEVSRRYMQSAVASIQNISQVQQMNLLGDPAVRLFGAKKPDYEVNDNNLFIESFDGEPVTALSDSFALHIISRNFGKAKQDTLKVRVTRTFNDNSTISYDSLFAPVLYQDTLVFIVKRERTSGFGNNRFTVTVDADNEFEELDETNNTAELSFFIPLNGTKNLYPHDFGIVNQQEVGLTFQATDLQSEEREFMLEIDTVNSFNSAYKKAFVVSGKVLIKHTTTLLSQDSLTYYWRTKLANPLPAESNEWSVNSFTYINDGPEGWAQMHFPQYLKNESDGLVRDVPLRELRFEETQTDLFVRSFGSGNPQTHLNVSIKINNAEYQITSQGQPCRDNTINLIAFDKVTAVPYAPFLIFDARTCGREPQAIVSYTTSEIEGGSNNILEYIDAIDAGDRVVLFSIKDAGYASWSATVKNKLGEIGISMAQIDDLTTGEPVVIIGRKGDAPGTAVVYKASVAPFNQQELVVNEIITGRYVSGSMTTPLIGPASHWESLVAMLSTPETEDEASVDVVGVNLKGEETVLMQDVAGVVDLTTVNTDDYPFLKLTYAAKDEINLTPVQLKKWIVVYTPVPEGLLFMQTSDDNASLQEGESLTMQYGFTNISDKGFADSLQVRFEVFNKTKRESELKTLLISAPMPGDTTMFSLTVETLGKSGLNDLDVFVNPRVIPERYYENNVLEQRDYLRVIPDQYKPVLDITIDGRYVSNGDYVSPNPVVLIRLWDENKTVLKKDTLGVAVFLQRPCDTDDCPMEPVYFTRSDIVWHAATDTSDFNVVFTPADLPVGVYRLRVETKDVSGNAPGAPYEITFEVNYESSLIMFAPHPNPTSGSVNFTIVISGMEAPGSIELSVTGVDGKQVYEMTQTGGFRIGTNTFTWDGRNSEGERLPAGLYIYRLIIRSKEGNELLLSPIPGNAALQKGYGKLALTR